ncbi:solute:Na+ symporter, BASS family protein [Psychroflexus gondwanensis ACAM 44]|uniref:Solute:Na+ symporter, BASS family protein n=1 Tax=Psychroflexus gondwanensis ACAM 44 TaxID=1189619 RepID=N1WUJ7_9FLAO|nr:bile acid:sodium symporter family protein [Psychroflexus gondwanensis]EMY82705.1 solute:Na+ symporter, BASS family protein [Psychroflexus gondwanensis ACAM 44]
MINYIMTAVELISKVFLPLALAIIMLGMGMTLIITDFTRVIKYPRAILIGLTNQLIFLPIIGFSLAIAFNLNPVMAVGLMILASCPGGPTSNLITQVCKGNIALSVTLTAVASLVSILTIPFILSYALEYFGSNTDVRIELPIIDTILQIMGITVIPISIGMLIRKHKTSFAKRMEKPMRTASTVIFILVFIAVLAANADKLIDGMKEAGLVTLVLNIATMGLGYLTARLFKLNLKNTISITIESGIQNGTLALVIATSILNNVEMGIPIGAYAIWMFLTAGILMWQLGKIPNSDSK